MRQWHFRLEDKPMDWQTNQVNRRLNRVNLKRLNPITMRVSSKKATFNRLFEFAMQPEKKSLPGGDLCVCGGRS